METFSTRQTAVIAAANKIVYWTFRIVDTADNIYYWSTSTIASSGSEVVSVGALESPGVYTDREWQRAHTFKIINFSGISLRRNKSESGIHAPSDVSFTIVNTSNAYTAANFKGGTVRIGLVIDDGSGRELVGSWRFVIKSASPYNQQIDVVCEDFLQQYLKGSYPDTKYISQIFPSKDNTNNDADGLCVPEPYGTCYIPLRSVYAVDDRYYLLGDTNNTYLITEVRSPREVGQKVAWSVAGYSFTQATKADAGSNNWRVFQPIIADSNLDGTADASGIWLSGSKILDMPAKFSRSDTSSVTSPADIIKYVLRNMGVNDDDLDLPSFDTAKTTFTSWSLTWNFAFWYKEDRIKVLSKLLAMCHSCLIVGEKIKLQVLSKTSQKTITEVEVMKQSDTSPSSFRYTDAIAEKNSDSGYVAWQQSGESQDEFIRTLVAAKSSTNTIDGEILELPGIQDSQQAQKLGTLYYQRKFLKVADVSATIKGTSLALRPDDVITMNYADFGGSYAVLINEMTINQDASIDIRCLKLSEALDDWGDLAPTAITVAAASSSGYYSPVIAGPDSPSSSPLPNVLPGRLRIGSTTSYILLTPTSPERISLYISDTEKFRLGDLNGYLGVVATTFGFGFGSSAASQANLIWDTTNGLRLRTATTNVFSVDNSGNAFLQSSLTLGKTGTASGTLTLQLNDGAGDTYIAAGKTDFTNVDAGFIFGLDDSDSNKAKLYVGDVTYYLNWTGSALNIAGAITGSTIDIGGADTTSFHVDVDGNMWLGAALFANGVFKVSNAGAVTATSGTIGGWILGATSLTDAAGVVGMSSAVTGGDDIRFWAGDATPGSAEFRVTESGALTASSATITGAITATSGTMGSFTIGTYLYTGSKTAYNDANAGVHLGSDGIGIGNNVFTVSSVGALVASSATITGAINATSGKFGTATNYWSVGATGLTATSASTDVIINYGKTDFTNVDTGFILGYDFSASAAKFYIGDATSYLNWDGSALTYTKGTLVETIIQMYTSVASLKTSATAGDGSADSAGVVVTYEGIFGCGANQTATVAAANANVQILATGSAILTGLIQGSYIYGSSLMTKGTYLSVTCAAADATLNVGSTTDFAASGTAYIIDSVNDRDTFTYTGKTSTTLTGCSGVLAHTVSSTNRPLVAPTTKGFYISDVTNELRFYGASNSSAGSTNIELASLGTSLSDGSLLRVGATRSRYNGFYSQAENRAAALFATYSIVDDANTKGIQASLSIRDTANVTNSISIIDSNLISEVSTARTYTEIIAYQASKTASLGENVTITTYKAFYDAGAGASTQIGAYGTYYGLHLGLVFPNPTTFYGVYQEDADAKNYFAGNVGLGTTTFGTSAVQVLGIDNGTAPSTSPADMIQMYSADVNAAAGDAGLHIRVEGGALYKFGDAAFLPGVDNDCSLGSATYRWANIYTADLHLANSQGDWTIKEGANKLFILNNKTRKKYSFVLQQEEDD